MATTATEFEKLLLSVRPLKSLRRRAAYDERGSANVNLTEAELRPMADYLASPTTCGYWKVTATWNYAGDFSRFLYEQLAAKFSPPKNKREAEVRAVLGVPLTSDQEQLLHKAFARISSVFALFTAGTREPDDGFKDESWLREVDLAAFRTRFESALELFQRDLFFDEFYPRVLDGPFRLKSGIVFSLSGPREDQTVVFASMAREPLKNLGEFLQAAGQVQDFVVERIFSPDEELFRPYFPTLSAAFGRVINDERVKPQFQQAFDYYSSKDYVHCISTLGLIAEDYLIQVYETYLREPCAKSQTLGQIYDSLHRRMSDLLAPVRHELKSLDQIYIALNEISAEDSEQVPAEAVARCLELIRDLTSTIKADRRYFTQRIDDLKRRDQRLSVFTPFLRDDINEMIRYRNAASHKTRVPLGNYEAVRALYCLTSLVMWWKQRRESTDWSCDRLEILRRAVAQSS